MSFYIYIYIYNYTYLLSLSFEFFKEKKNLNYHHFYLSGYYYYTLFRRILYLCHFVFKRKKKLIYAYKILNIIHELIQYMDISHFVLHKK